MRSEEEKSAELLRCGGAVLSRPQVPWKLLRGGFSRIEASGPLILTAAAEPHLSLSGGGLAARIRFPPTEERALSVRFIY